MTDTLPAPLWYDEAVMLARAVVAEFGEHYIDPRAADDEDCAYVLGDDPEFYPEPDDEEPGCIVGQILHHHGVPLRVLRQWEGKAAHDMGPAGCATYNHALKETVRGPGPTAPLIADQRTTDFLQALQLHQDEECPWGEALEEALAGRLPQ